MCSAKSWTLPWQTSDRCFSGGHPLCMELDDIFFSFRNFGNIVQSWSKVTIQITSPDDLQDVVVNASDPGSCLISCSMCQGFWVFRCRSSTQYLLVWNLSMKRWKRRQMTLEDTVYSRTLTNVQIASNIQHKLTLWMYLSLVFAWRRTLMREEACLEADLSLAGGKLKPEE